jgi:hypothetical protein
MRNGTPTDTVLVGRYPLMGHTIKACVERVPRLHVEASIQPITRRVLRVTLKVEADFEWVVKVRAFSFWFWFWFWWLAVWLAGACTGVGHF